MKKNKILVGVSIGLFFLANNIASVDAQQKKNTMQGSVDYSAGEDASLESSQRIQQWLNRWQPESKGSVVTKAAVVKVAKHYEPYPACHPQNGYFKDPNFMGMWE